MARIAQIVSTARCLPEHVVTNAELTKRFTALGRPDVINKLAGSTGINQRFYAPKDWVTSDLALAAAKEALKRAGANPRISIWLFSARRHRTTSRRTRRCPPTQTRRKECRHFRCGLRLRSLSGAGRHRGRINRHECGNKGDNGAPLSEVKMNGDLGCL
jgi:hypothetical protein